MFASIQALMDSLAQQPAGFAVDSAGPVGRQAPTAAVTTVCWLAAIGLMTAGFNTLRILPVDRHARVNT